MTTTVTVTTGGDKAAIVELTENGAPTQDAVLVEVNSTRQFTVHGGILLAVHEDDDPSN